MASGQRHQVAQHSFRLLLGEDMAVRQRGGKMFERDRGLARRRWIL
jgi:hypothetical protein